MRLFIAIELPEEVKEELIRLQNEFSGLGKINFVRAFHLTLKFLGEVPDEKVSKIKERLKGISFEPFKVKLSNVGAFPNENYIRVIWVGLESEKINELQKKIDDCLEGLFEKEKRFSAHVTLGRVKLISDKQKLKDKLKKEVKDLGFPVNKFKLIKSELKSDGPVYSDLEVYCL